MNRERAKELLPIIEAFAAGDELEVRADVDDATWYPCSDPLFSISDKYRIKPKPREFWLDLSDATFIEAGKGSKYWGEEHELIKVREVE